MRIRIDTGKTNGASSALLSISKSTRRLKAEVEDVRHQLRQLSQLDGCRAELAKQEEALTILTARLVNMSTALSQISDTYGLTENRNSDHLEECDRFQGVTRAVLFSVNNRYRKQIDQILYK